MEEKEHVINLLQEARKAARKGDVITLKELSQKTVHSSLIYQEEEYIIVSVLFYSLSKIIEKGKRYYKENYQNYVDNYIKIIDNSILLLKKNDTKSFKDQLKKIMSSK